MLIIISDLWSPAERWARMGRLPLFTYLILTDKKDCEKLSGVELSHQTPIARVGDIAPRDLKYIEDSIKTRIK